MTALLEKLKNELQKLRTSDIELKQRVEELEIENGFLQGVAAVKKTGNETKEIQSDVRPLKEKPIVPPIPKFTDPNMSPSLGHIERRTITLTSSD